MIITEDVVAAGGEFLDALSPYSPDQAARSLAELAQLHATTSGLAPARDRALARVASHHVLRVPRASTTSSATSRVRSASTWRAQVADARAARRRVTRCSPHAREGPGWAVIHGDAHVGNVFLDADGAPALVDWQVVQRGHWGIDVGYHIASALDHGRPRGRRA